jgi:CRP/FNR family cyclic AMP-dependent transcriptional regulator
MKMKELEKILGEHLFLKGLHPKLVKPISGCASSVSYDAGQMIYREEDDADQFLLILEGKVAIEIFVPGRGPLTIQTIGPGDVLGWSWLFPPYKRQFDARAVERTTGIALDGRRLREMVEEDHDFGYELIKRFSQVAVTRLRAMSRQLLDIYGKHS